MGNSMILQEGFNNLIMVHNSFFDKQLAKVATTLLGVFLFFQSNAQLVSPSPTKINLANAVICVDSSENVLVKKTAEFFQHDIELVTGKKLAITGSLTDRNANYIIIGTVGNSS
ncbi:MAG: hypothetical protein ABIS01_12890, partial [Ferruginibacter sp.]